MKMLNILILILFSISILFAGCNVPCKQVKRYSGPDKKNIAQAIDPLENHRKNVLPVRAKGKLKYIPYENGKKKNPDHLDVDFRFDPPRKLFFRANSILGEAVRLGSNNEEFWLRMKPKELSLYWWGKSWRLENCHSQLMLSPESILEAIGMVKIDSDWLLVKEDNKDVLIKLDDQDKYFKKVYVDRASYLIEKIEHYDGDGYVFQVLKLGDYTCISDGSPMPASITISSFKRSVPTSRIEISLKNLRHFDPSMAKKKLFQRPSTEGFKYIYQLGDDCNFIQQNSN